MIHRFPDSVINVFYRLDVCALCSVPFFVPTYLRIYTYIALFSLPFVLNYLIPGPLHKWPTWANLSPFEIQPPYRGSLMYKFSVCDWICLCFRVEGNCENEQKLLFKPSPAQLQNGSILRRVENLSVLCHIPPTNHKIL